MIRNPIAKPTVSNDQRQLNAIPDLIAWILTEAAARDDTIALLSGVLD